MSDNWRTHANYWSSFYEVHAIDQRNHGKSFHSGQFHYTVLAQDIVAYMDAHNLKDTIVLGHSMGGKTAMTLALLYPDRVSKLIVVDISPKTYDVSNKFSSIIHGLLQLDQETLSSRTQAEEVLTPFVPEVAVRQFLLKNLVWTPQKTLELKCHIQVLKTKLVEIGAAPPAGMYSGETLFIAGENSDYVVEDDMPNIRTLFPKAKLAWVKNAGHWLHAENPKGFTESLLDFLNY